MILSILSTKEAALEDRNLNLSNTIYENLKNKIIDCELVPGTVVPERGYAQELGISRTPVREALKRLCQDGLITWEERRRAVVSEIAELDVVELFIMRDMIEPYAVKKVFFLGHQSILAGILATVYNEMEHLKGDQVSFIKKDMDFHSQIVQTVCVNKLSTLWQKISDEITRLGIYAMHSKRSPEEILSEHKLLVDAFWNNDLEGALNAIHSHHKNTQEAYRAKQLLTQTSHINNVPSTLTIQ